MQLYSYFRSSAAYRVRIGLNLKGLPYQTIPVHLLKDGGQQRSAQFLALNPHGLIPVLAENGSAIQQSLAILEYLEETHPTPSLLPGTALDRAWIRSLALAIACDIHPLDNLRVLKYLKHQFGISNEQKDAWYAHWIRVGFEGLEKRLAGDPRVGKCCFGDTPTLADACLIPQVFNAIRIGVDMTLFPTLARINAYCNSLPAFVAAAPAAQPDAE